MPQIPPVQPEQAEGVEVRGTPAEQEFVEQAAPVISEKAELVIQNSVPDLQAAGDASFRLLDGSI